MTIHVVFSLCSCLLTPPPPIQVTTYAICFAVDHRAQCLLLNRVGITWSFSYPCMPIWLSEWLSMHSRAILLRGIMFHLSSGQPECCYSGVQFDLLATMSLGLSNFFHCIQDVLLRCTAMHCQDRACPLRICHCNLDVTLSEVTITRSDCM